MTIDNQIDAGKSQKVGEKDVKRSVVEKKQLKPAIA